MASSIQLASRTMRPTNPINPAAEIERLLNEAEAALTAHFQELRKWFERQGYRMEAPHSTTTNDSHPRLFKEKLERLDEQRYREQNQMRSTMQQLSEAWLRLESEQRDALGQSGSSGVTPQGLLASEAAQNAADEPSWESLDSTRVFSRTVDPDDYLSTLAELDSTLRQSRAEHLSGTQVAANLFHRLQRELNDSR